MELKIRTITLALVAALAAGCAGTGTEERAARLTYTWEAPDRATQLAFQETHSACTRTGDIGEYETCMIRNGFARVDD